MDVDERFAAIADAMRRAGMSSQQMSYHLRQLGIRQSSVINLLQGGGDEIRRSRQAVEDFGVAVSDIDAAAIERANDALSDIGRVIEGIGNRLAVTVAPMLERMAVRFTDLAREGGAVRTAIDRLVEGFARLAEVVTSDAFIDAAVSALEGLMRFAGGAAEALVFLANNFELAAGGAAALAGQRVLLHNYGNWMDRYRDQGSQGFQAAGAQAGIQTQQGDNAYGYGATKAGNQINYGNAMASARGIGVNNLLGAVGAGIGGYNALFNGGR
jgi:hypothetical protein